MKPPPLTSIRVQDQHITTQQGHLLRGYRVESQAIRRGEIVELRFRSTCEYVLWGRERMIPSAGGYLFWGAGSVWKEASPYIALD